VGEGVSTMDEIGTSARKILDIIGAIDRIALQVNFSALNAAMESARAGEPGCGFAAVASEGVNGAGGQAVCHERVGLVTGRAAGGGSTAGPNRYSSTPPQSR
jgi:Methyl-accepting chemotaxis protein (MCP) signalling domain